WRLAEEVAAANGWSTSPDELAARYRDHAAAQREADERRRALRREIEAKRGGLAAELGARWPEAATRALPVAGAATPESQLAPQLPALAAALEADERYAALVELQDSLPLLA